MQAGISLNITGNPMGIRQLEHSTLECAGIGISNMYPLTNLDIPLQFAECIMVCT